MTMKKNLIVASAVVALALTACGPKMPQASLTTEVDSLSYALGYGPGAGVKMQLQRQKIDTAKAGDFVAGYLKGVYADPKAKQEPSQIQTKIASFFGDQMHQVKGDDKMRQLSRTDSTQLLNVDMFVAGVLAVTENGEKVPATLRMDLQKAFRELSDTTATVNLDSLSFKLGLQQGSGVINELARQKVDTANLSTFVSTFKSAFKNGLAPAKKAIMLGEAIGEQSAMNFPRMNAQIFAGDSTMEISKANYVAGYVDAVYGKKDVLSDSLRRDVQKRLQSKFRTAAMEKQYGPNREAGEKFLEENAKKEGIVVLPSGVQYKVIKKGRGKMPKVTDKVEVAYEGTLIDGTVFDSSYKRKKDAEFGVGQVIPGWTEVLQLMPVGSTYMVYIPQDKAYGARQAGRLIKPYSTLIFKVELKKIVKK